MGRRDRAERAEELLDRIEELVLAEGFSRLTVGELASRLRCSRSAFYELAPSKAELMRTVFARFVQRVLDDADRQAQLKESPADRVLTYGAVVREWQDRGSLAFWEDVRTHDLMRGVLDLGFAQSSHTVEGFLDAGVAAGEFRPMNSLFVAHLIWLCSDATRDPDALRHAGLDAGQATEEMMRFVVHGLAPIPDTAEA